MPPPEIIEENEKNPKSFLNYKIWEAIKIFIYGILVAGLYFGLKMEIHDVFTEMKHIVEVNTNQDSRLKNLEEFVLEYYKNKK